jgi:ribosomal protein L7/L12
MPTVRFTSWDEGLQKVALDRAIRDQAGVGLAEAKAVVDRLLADGSSTVRVPTMEAARTLVVAARGFGAEAELADSSE